MNKFQIQNYNMFLVPSLMAGLLILSLFICIIYSQSDAEKFTIVARINLKKLDNLQKLKVVASANGNTLVKNETGNDLDSKSTSVLFELNQKNDIVRVGNRDEYFVCVYAVNATSQMESYSWVESNI